MISNELLEEIIYLSMQNKFLNKDIIKRIFNELLDQLDPITKSNFSAVIYEEIDRKNKIRGICYDQLGIIKYDLYQMYVDEKKSKYLNMLEKNMNILSTIIHELEHLKEPVKITKGDFEGRLLTISNVDSIENLNAYSCIPSEKIAYATSWESLLNNISLYPYFSEDYENEYAFINNQYIGHLKLGYVYDAFYDKYNVPLYNFLSATKQLSSLTNFGKFVVSDKKQEKVTKFSLEERLKYGLPIIEKDIEEINKKKILRKKY